MHWKGPEIDESLLANFKNYLIAEKLHNANAMEQLIDNVRDEIASDRQPSQRIFTLLTITLAIAIGIWQPVYSQLLTLWVKSQTEIWQVTGLTIVVCLFLIGYGTAIPWAYFSSRTRLEKYLHSLTAIRLKLLMSTDIDLNELTINENSETKGSDRNSWFIILFLLLFVLRMLESLRRRLDCA